MKRLILGLLIGLFHLPSYWCLSLRSNFNSIDQNNITSNDTIVFICNANISNVALEWYVNDEVIAIYPYRDGQSFPKTITPMPMNSRYEVQISSAISENGFINYENFTLAIPLCDIAALEVKVQCGNSLVKSNTIAYGLANLTGTIKLTSTAIYSGSDGLIQQIMLKLENLEFEIFGCDVNMNYYVNLKVNSTTICSTIITPFDCGGQTCSDLFPCNISEAIALNNSFVYAVITVNNVTNIYSPEVETSALRIFGDSSIDSCSPAIMCSESYGGDCVIQYGSDPNYQEFNSASPISPGNNANLLKSDSTSQTFVQVTQINNNSKFVLQYDLRNENSLKSRDDSFVLAIGWIALIMGIILSAIGYITTWIYWNHFRRNGIMIIVGLKLISAVFLVTAIVLFISYYSTFKEDSCGTKVQNYSTVISAVVVSLIYCAYSACFTGAIYILPKIDMFDNDMRSRDGTKLTFGKYIYNSSNGRCPSCNKYLFPQWELCQSCSKYFCKSCIGNSEAFIFRNMKMGKVCPSCDIKYCEENKKIMEADSVAELAKLQNTVTDGECCVCNKLKHEDYKCSSCSQNICKKHFKKLPKEVTKQFSIDEGNYCYFCYDIYMRKYNCKNRTQTTTSL